MQDAVGFTVNTNCSYPRVISLVPSQTEYLIDLGIMPIGRTRFCEHPAIKDVPIVGGTKDFIPEKIRELRPDLILANKEENTREPLLKLRETIPIFTTDVHDLKSALGMMTDIGLLLNKEKQAQELCNKILKAFENLSQNNKQGQQKSVLYLIWKSPWMSVGRDTFIHNMLSHCHLTNTMANHTRYPEITEKTLKEMKPDLIFLSSEPYPFKVKHIPELQRLCPDSKISCVDGAIFSWYGSRLLKAPDYFKSLMIY